MSAGRRTRLSNARARRGSCRRWRRLDIKPGKRPGFDADGQTFGGDGGSATRIRGSRRPIGHPGRA